MRCLKKGGVDGENDKQDKVDASNKNNRDNTNDGEPNSEPLMLENLSDSKDKENKKGKNKKDKKEDKVDPVIRRAFIRKVYCILSAQLIVTTAIVAFIQLFKPIREWLQGPGSWFYYASYGVFFITNMALMCCCCSKIRRKYPANLICLTLYTLSFSYVLATIASYYQTPIVIITLAMTTIVCIAVIVFNLQPKKTFTMRPGLLYTSALVLILTGVSCLLAWQLRSQSLVKQSMYAGIASLLFSLFLVFRTQRLAGDLKKSKKKDDYVYATLKLYVGVTKGNPWKCAKECCFGKESK